LWKVLDDLEIQKNGLEVAVFRKVQLEWLPHPFCHFDARTIQAGLLQPQGLSNRRRDFQNSILQMCTRDASQ
jgi:hypothetical protein